MSLVELLLKLKRYKKALQARKIFIDILKLKVKYLVDLFLLRIDQYNDRNLYWLIEDYLAMNQV